MQTCNRNFPGADPEVSDQLAQDVAADEKAIVDAIGGLRQGEASSLEAIGYLLGTDPARISRHLMGQQHDRDKLSKDSPGFWISLQNRPGTSTTAGISQEVLTDLRVGAQSA